MNECTTASVLKAPQNKGYCQPIATRCSHPEQCQPPTHPPNQHTNFAAGTFASLSFVFIFPAGCVCSLVTWPPPPEVVSTSRLPACIPCRVVSLLRPCKCYSKSAGFLSQTTVWRCHCHCFCCLCMPCVCLQWVSALCGLILLAFVVRHLQVYFHLCLLCMHAHLHWACMSPL